MITEFQGQYRWLSNFWRSPILYERIKYPTVEHAYQAAKSTNYEYKKMIATLPTPGDAKRAGREATLRPDWEKIKVDVMRALLWIKFQGPELRAKLLATGDEVLQEGNRWRDVFWGVDIKTGRGENTLGKLLMSIREAVGKEKQDE